MTATEIPQTKPDKELPRSPFLYHDGTVLVINHLYHKSALEPNLARTLPSHRLGAEPNRYRYTIILTNIDPHSPSTVPVTLSHPFCRIRHFLNVSTIRHHPSPTAPEHWYCTRVPVLCSSDKQTGKIIVIAKTFP